MNRLDDLETFVCVAENASIRRAAEQLDRAPSAVSRRIKELEARLQTQLLNRTTRQITLTGAGERFLVRARQIIEDLAEAEALAMTDTQTVSGELKLTIPLSFGLAHLAPAISDFMTSNPQVKINADYTDRTVDIVGTRTDLAIRIGMLANSTLKSRQLAPVHHVVAAAPAFWEKWGTPKKPEMLSGMPALCYSNLTSPSVWFWCNARGRQGQVVVDSRYRSSNGDALVQAAINAHGVIRLPTFMVNDAIAKNWLQPVLLPINWGISGLHAVYPNTAFLPNKTRAFIDFLVERFGDEPEWDLCLRSHLKAINKSVPHR